MKHISFISNFNLLFGSVSFIRRHYKVLLGLGLIAGFGRVIQLGGFGEIQGWQNIALEVVVEGSRILMFFYVLGLANVKKGIEMIGRIFSRKSNLKGRLQNAIQKLKKNWLSTTLSFTGFLIIAGVFNFLIDQLAYQTCLYLSLKQEGILVDTSSEWTILLFFKNILVIPFTLVFETLFLLWLANKTTQQVQHTQGILHL